MRFTWKYFQPLFATKNLTPQERLEAETLGMIRREKLESYIIDTAEYELEKIEYNRLKEKYG